MTREQTYSQLLMAVSENDKKIDKLRIDHEELGERLHELQMDDDQGNQHKKKRDDGNPFSPEIEELDQKIVGLNKEKDKSIELNKKVNLVFDQVQGWCSKVIQKIDSQFQENIGSHQENSKTLAYLFEKISEAVCKQLEQIINEEDDEDRGYITAKDFMNDFATDDFLNKNIRVRPMSGVTRAEDEGHNKSMNDPFGQGGDDYDKFAQMQELEMKDQREIAKAKKEAFLKQKALEEERALKKKK